MSPADLLTPTRVADVAGEAGPVRVHVPLGERAYDILVGRGLLAGAGERIAALRARSVAIVSDETVAGLYGAALSETLKAAGLAVSLITVPPGEGSKSFADLEKVCAGLLSARIERGDLVVALGGGVVGDLAGFAAAIVRRGLRFVQIPTTLLAQVDSSVGGKTGINTAQGKNLVGAFHQPALVLADTALLDTLPEREFRAGFAEVVKYGLIGDAPFFDWCIANWPAIRSGADARDQAVAQSCRAKADVVVADEREDGERALLNLGHTFGHALERIVAYDGQRLVHGEGVAIGMALAFRFSATLGLCSAATAEEVGARLRGIGLPTSLADVPGGAGSPDDILSAMYQDKKVQGGQLTFILARGIGQSFVARGIDPGPVRAFLEAESGSQSIRHG
jgi:3-dehydroquinate synthase